MSVELHLPDLPEVPISLGRPPATPPRARLPWHQRLRDLLTAYLPLLLMAVLALGSWWLVKNAPSPAAPRDKTALRGDPDYTMQRFTLQRFAPDGRLRVRLEGRELRHYPASDRIEIDSVQIQAFAPDGRVTHASARQAVSNGATNEVQLEGGAVLTGIDAQGRPMAIRSEFLHAFLDADIVQTDRAVQVEQGRNVLRAAGLVYDHARQRLELKGPMRAVLRGGSPG